MDDQKGLEAALQNFTGTQNYYRNFTSLLYTDGIQHLAERAGAYWLIDLVGSYQPRLRDAPFQLWELKVNTDRSALVTMVEDDGMPNRVSQDIPYTDFPLNDFSFYCCYDGQIPVMLLKSEY